MCYMLGANRATRKRCPPCRKLERVVIGDLTSIAQTRSVAGQVNALGSFDAVIHNAGIGCREPRRIETEDGLPHVLAVNTLAPYILTALIQKPKRSVPSAWKHGVRVAVTPERAYPVLRCSPTNSGSLNAVRPSKSAGATAHKAPSITCSEEAKQQLAFAQELPCFLAAIRQVFNPYEIVGYVARQKPRTRKALQNLLYLETLRSKVELPR